MQELIDDCVHCGFCLPACPTYSLWGQEMDSPRGRIELMDQVLSGCPGRGRARSSISTAAFRAWLVSAPVPSGVRYGEIIEAARVEIERTGDRPSFASGWRAQPFSASFPTPAGSGWLAWRWLRRKPRGCGPAAATRSGRPSPAVRSGPWSLSPRPISRIEVLPARIAGRRASPRCSRPAYRLRAKCFFLTGKFRHRQGTGGRGVRRGGTQGTGLLRGALLARRPASPRRPAWPSRPLTPSSPPVSSTSW